MIIIRFASKTYFAGFSIIIWGIKSYDCLIYSTHLSRKLKNKRFAYRSRLSYLFVCLLCITIKIPVNAL